MLLTAAHFLLCLIFNKTWVNFKPGLQEGTDPSKPVRAYEIFAAGLSLSAAMCSARFTEITSRNTSFQQNSSKFSWVCITQTYINSIWIAVRQGQPEPGSTPPSSLRFQPAGKILWQNPVIQAYYLSLASHSLTALNYGLNICLTTYKLAAVLFISSSFVLLLMYINCRGLPPPTNVDYHIIVYLKLFLPLILHLFGELRETFIMGESFQTRQILTEIYLPLACFSYPALLIAKAICGEVSVSSLSQFIFIPC